MSIFDFFKRNNKKEIESITLSESDRFKIKSEILRLMKKGIVMEPDKRVEKLSQDACKIGGKPYVPADFIWPTYTSKEDNVTRPLSFFCQLNLADITSLDEEKQLPTKGMLSFFYECESYCCGVDSNDNGAVRVFYFEDLTDFIAFKVPEELNEDYIYSNI